MARKARRRKQSVLTQSQLEGTRAANSVAADKVMVEVQTPEPTARVEVNFAEEYRYVVADLSRVGILAAVMLAVLIILNLVLR